MGKFSSWLYSKSRPVRWLIVFALLVVALLTAITVSATTWEYSNSPEFCGTTCHTMPPEYTAYQISPHARVDCVDCHLGQEGVIQTIPRKARELRHVVNALTKAYEPPIYVKSLRPARDTCEQCHNPEKFSSDTFVEIKRFDQDEENTEESNHMVIKTGGGTSRDGLGKGIHWHIENEVWFDSDDKIKQTIPYVKSVGPDGEVTEYFDVEAGLPPDYGEQVDESLQRMDCIDCHTRISHLFRSPTDAMDDLMARNRIDTSIPFIKWHGVNLLGKNHGSTEEGMGAIAALTGWYRANEPDYYADTENQEAIQEAIVAIQEAFTTSVFPNLDIGWQTHPDNSGHAEFPGCFRCHDGKHTSPRGETIRLECNLCHSIPSVVASGEAAPVVSIDKPGEPESHLDSNWMARHQFQFDESCATCHDVGNPGGSDNSSFCANSACHATEWKYVGLNAPEIRKLVAPPRVPGTGEANEVPHPIGDRTDCTLCHGSEGVYPYPESHSEFADQSLCIQCHQPVASQRAEPAAEESEAVVDQETEEDDTPAVIEEEAEEPEQEEPRQESDATTSDELDEDDVDVEEGQSGIGISDIPQIPHLTAGRDQCLVCHGPETFKPYPDDHDGRTTDSCQNCHQPATPEGDPNVAGETAPDTSAESEEEAEQSETDAAEADEDQDEAAADEPQEEDDSDETATVPPIPHPLEGRDQCLVCHGPGTFKAFPEDHAGRTTDTCLSCHQPATP